MTRSFPQATDARGSQVTTTFWRHIMRRAALLAWVTLTWLAGAGATSSPGTVQAASPKRTRPTGQVIESDARLLVDLSKPNTYVILQAHGEVEAICVTDIRVKDLPARHRLDPEAGVVRLGHPVDIRLKKPDNVRIRLALVRRGDAVALRASPQVMIGRHEAIALSEDRIERTRRVVRRHVKDQLQRLSAVARERNRLSLWLATPGNKPLDAVRMAQARMKILDRTLQSLRGQLPTLQRQCAILAQVAAFVQELHENAEIHFSVGIRSQSDDNNEGN